MAQTVRLAANCADRRPPTADRISESFAQLHDRGADCAGVSTGTSGQPTFDAVARSRLFVPNDVSEVVRTTVSRKPTAAAHPVSDQRTAVSGRHCYPLDVFEAIGEVLYLVADPAAAEAWYSRLTGIEAQAPGVLRLPAGEIVFHVADDTMPAGGARQVAYFDVADFDAARERIEAMGGALYRGPLERPDRRRMAQFRDPFGNLLGIRG